MAQRKTQKHLANRADAAAASGSASESIVRVFDDPEDSIKQLIAQAHQRRFEPRHSRGPPLPSSFFVQKPRNRGSSAGHSPQGSSDDGIGSNSRNTLSPGSISSSGPSPAHKRQVSAPELLNNQAIHEMYNHRPMQPAPPLGGGNPSHSQSVPQMPQMETSHDLFPPQALHTRSVSDHHSGGYGNYPSSYVEHPKLDAFDHRAKSQSMGHIHPQHSSHPSLIPVTVPQEVDDGLGPLPNGWTFSYDNNGDKYYIDHIQKTTTWFDPRRPMHLQEDAIRLKHGRNEVGAGAAQSVYQPSMVEQYGAQLDFNSHAAATQQRVQQLEMERNSLQERRNQLIKQGLVDPMSPQFPGQPVSPMQTLPQDYAQYAAHPAAMQDMRSRHLMSTNVAFTHDRNISNDSAVDNMDVDYSLHHTMAPTGNLPGFSIDASLSDINPQEFDRYLQLGDHRMPSAVARQQ